MRRASGLDLTSLRRTRPASVPTPHGTAELGRITWAPPPPSRRDLLKMLGIAAVTAHPLASAAAAFASLGPVGIEQRGRRAVFVVGGEAVFTIDPARFAGRPVLRVSRTEGCVFRVDLRGARYPGTDVRADLSMVLDGATERLTITLAAGSFRAVVNARDWLLGKTPAESPMAPLGLIAVLDTRGEIRSDRAGRARFWPDWRLEVSGRRCATAEVFGQRIASSNVEIRLLDEADPTAIGRSLRRRCAIRIERGRASWSLRPDVLAPEAGALSWAAEPVDAVVLEAAEASTGRRYRALTADVRDGGAAFTPSRASGFDGIVPLAGVRLAAAFDAAGDQVAVISDGVASRVRFDGLGVDLDDDPEHSAFEASGRQRASAVTFRPRISALHASFEGALVEPLLFPGDSPVFAPIGADPGGPAGAMSLFAAGASALALPDGTAVRVVRPDDLLVLTFRFYGWQLLRDDAGVRTLRELVPGAGAKITVEFPPQSFHEQAFTSSTGGLPPVYAQIADPSRLAFQVPTWTAASGIPYTLDGLLSWSEWTPLLAPGATPWGPPFVDDRTLVDPRTYPFYTYIEMPWHLDLSPNYEVRWSHSAAPRTSGAWTALWTTRLMQNLSLALPPGAPRPTPTPLVRAIWASGDPPSFTGSTKYPITADQREKLVDNMTFQGLDPAKAPLLMLSSQGGWLNLEGHWPTSANGLVEWRHRATQGRDHFVRIVETGFLFPFGHRCVKITDTERRIARNATLPGGPAARQYAYLFQETYLMVVEPVKDYTDPSMFDRRGRAFPFKSVEIVTTRTPSLAPATQFVGGGVVSAENAFFPEMIPSGTTQRQRVLFEVMATDRRDYQSKFFAPLAWVSKAVDDDVALSQAAADSYPGQAGRATLSGQQVSLAAPEPGQPGMTLVECAGLTFAGEVLVGQDRSYVPFGKPRFVPAIGSIDLDSSRLAELTGSAARGTGFEFWGPYLDRGFDPAGFPGQVFLVAGSTPLALNSQAPKTGGIAAVRIAVTGFSRAFGPFGGLAATFDSGRFEPASYFGTAPVLGQRADSLAPTANAGAPAIPDAKLFGSLLLSQLLPAINDLSMAPKVSVEDLETETVTRLSWTYVFPADAPTVDIFDPRLGSIGWSGNNPVYTGDQPATLALVNETHMPKDGSPVTNSVTGVLANFRLNFPGSGSPLLVVGFNSLTFTSGTGKSTSVSPDLAAVTFGGKLRFLNELAPLFELAEMTATGMRASSRSQDRALASEGDAGAGWPSVRVTSEGVEVSSSALVPNISLVIAALVNINVGAKVLIPLVDAPARFGFSLGTREQPFGVMVCLLSGFGHFAMDFTADGLQTLDVSLECGAMVSVNFGVASGTVSLSYCVAFSRGGEDGITMIAYYRLAGGVSVLGLVHLSMVATLGLGLNITEKPDGAGGTKQQYSLIGEATVVFKVKVAFFKKTVSFKITKEIAGTDPPFEQMFPEDLWATYCGAFAPAKGA